MSETATAPPSSDDAATTDAPDTGAPDLASEVEKWKAQSRKHEERAKANANAAKELETLKQASMSELEKAVERAKAEGHAEAITKLGAERVADAIRVATAGRDLDVDALLEGLDRSRFLTESGEPDREAITAWIERIAPKSEPKTPDLGQGARGSNTQALNGDPLLRDLKSKLGIQ